MSIVLLQCDRCQFIGPVEFFVLNSENTHQCNVCRFRNKINNDKKDLIEMEEHLNKINKEHQERVGVHERTIAQLKAKVEESARSSLLEQNKQDGFKQENPNVWTMSKMT